MPRIARVRQVVSSTTVLNRGNARRTIFHKNADARAS